MFIRNICIYINLLASIFEDMKLSLSICPSICRSICPPFYLLIWLLISLSTLCSITVLISLELNSIYFFYNFISIFRGREKVLLYHSHWRPQKWILSTSAFGPVPVAVHRILWRIEYSRLKAGKMHSRPPSPPKVLSQIGRASCRERVSSPV